MSTFHNGQKVYYIAINSEDVIERNDLYTDMEISMENGQMAGVPWVKVTKKITENNKLIPRKKVEMYNCALLLNVDVEVEPTNPDLKF